MKKSNTPNNKYATVISQNHQLYLISVNESSGNHQVMAEISGQMAYSISSAEQYPVVGDRVEVSYSENDDVAIIHRILPRKSLLSRASSGVGQGVQPIAANVDTVFITMALDHNFNLRRMERYLTIVWDSGAQPVIVLTKADLTTDLENQLAQVSEIALGVTTFVTSDSDFSEIANFLTQNPQTVVFVGSSGVGKSTLINRLLGYEAMATSENRESDSKGRHTTTNRQLFSLANGTQIIDTPGMRELQVDTGDSSATFADIEELATRCKFRNCTHKSEPGCAIIEAIDTGKLSAERFANYLKISRENRYSRMNTTEIAADKFRRHFGSKSGAKAVRDIKKGKRLN